MKINELDIDKQFWAVVRRGDPKGYHTGFAGMETILIQTDTATELNEFLGEGSVISGESMGAYVFKVVAISHNNLNELQDFEEQDKKNAELEREYYEEDMRRWENE